MLIQSPELLIPFVAGQRWVGDSADCFPSQWRSATVRLNRPVVGAVRSGPRNISAPKCAHYDEERGGDASSTPRANVPQHMVPRPGPSRFHAYSGD